MAFNIERYLEGDKNNNNNNNYKSAGRKMTPDKILLKHALVRDDERKLLCCRYCKKPVKLCFCIERPHDKKHCQSLKSIKVLNALILQRKQ